LSKCCASHECGCSKSKKIVFHCYLIFRVKELRLMLAKLLRRLV
jgi:hypothetical protein